MSQVAKQNEFLTHVALLILQAQDMGFVVTGGELWRTPEQQEIYFRIGKSKTLISKHLDRLAIDLNFFKDGIYINGLENKSEVKEILQPIGFYWESLHPENKWGGNFTNIFDSPHFERR